MLAGIICVTFSKRMTSTVATCFMDRVVDKYYLAIVHGHFTTPSPATSTDPPAPTTPAATNTACHSDLSGGAVDVSDRDLSRATFEPPPPLVGDTQSHSTFRTTPTTAHPPLHSNDTQASKQHKPQRQGQEQGNHTHSTHTSSSDTTYSFTIQAPIAPDTSDPTGFRCCIGGDTNPGQV